MNLVQAQARVGGIKIRSNSIYHVITGSKRRAWRVREFYLPT
jgi:hypothetical protein